MAVERTVKAGRGSARLVAVVASTDDLQRARRLRRNPDLFELRLDALVNATDELATTIRLLAAPLIITARHPAEGGANDLSAQRRREILLEFLPHASHVDVELRSAANLRLVLESAAASGVRRIISVHDFRRTPSTHRFHELARAAEELGADIFKIAVRTDTAAELDRLVDCFETVIARMPVTAMGIGKLGRVSRTLFAQRGSALNYVHLGAPQAEGQLSLAEMRRVLDR